MWVSRKLNTGDPADYVIEKGKIINFQQVFRFGYFEFHFLNYAETTFIIDPVTDNISAVVNDSGKDLGYYEDYKVHGWLMWTAWGILSFI